MKSTLAVCQSLTSLQNFKRLTKATLTTVTCCVKIQNKCSESFETRQGIRQGDVLSTLIFNVVLEVIVRRAYKQPVQSSTKKRNYSHMPMI
jgi:hypothetical protein